MCLFTTACFSASAGAQYQSQELTKKLEELTRKHKVPSMAFAVAKSSGVATAGCFGVRKRGENSEVQLSDRRPLGSCTKSMTGTLAAVLVDAGKIQWTTTIGEVWPQATGDSIHPDLRDVTLDDLLSHQSLSLIHI